MKSKLKLLINLGVPVIIFIGLVTVMSFQHWDKLIQFKNRDPFILISDANWQKIQDKKFKIKYENGLEALVSLRAKKKNEKDTWEKKNIIDNIEYWENYLVANNLKYTNLINKEKNEKYNN
jgi:hypothetical protein